MTKRANGEGSIRKRPDGRWEARYVSPKDGKQRSLYGRTRTEVRQKLTAIMSEVDCGTYIDASNLTVGEWLDLWLKDFCGDLKPTTMDNYARCCRLHIKPRLGAVKLDKLTKINVQLMVNELAETGLAQSTVRIIFAALSTALQKAVQMDLLRSNPCTDVVASRGKKEKMCIVDRDKFSDFITAANKSGHGDILIFGLLTGMRSAELRGLRWSDIDMSTGTVSIVRQLAYVGHEHFFQSPKSGSSRRFCLSGAALSLLKQHRIRQNEQRLKMGAGWVNNELSEDLVFRMDNGSFYHARTLVRTVKMVGPAIGLPQLTPHDLRHSFAVAALRSGMDVKTLQSILGHASASITLDVYAHYTEDMSAAAAARLDAYWNESIT